MGVWVLGVWVYERMGVWVYGSTGLRRLSVVWAYGVPDRAHWE